MALLNFAETTEDLTTTEVAITVKNHAGYLQGRIIEAEAELERLRAAFDATAQANNVLAGWDLDLPLPHEAAL
jgi:phage-related minor tail protein